MGPSDAFFEDVVKTVGGQLSSALHDLKKKQAAAKALGADVSLAELAMREGLIDQAKREEIALLENSGEVPAPPVEVVEAPAPVAETAAAPAPPPSNVAPPPSPLPPMPPPAGARSSGLARSGSSAEPKGSQARSGSKARTGSGAVPADRPPAIFPAPLGTKSSGKKRAAAAQCNICASPMGVEDYVASKGLCARCLGKTADTTGPRPAAPAPAEERRAPIVPRRGPAKLAETPSTARAGKRRPGEPVAPQKGGAGVVLAVVGIVLVGALIGVAIYVANDAGKPADNGPGPETPKVADAKPKPPKPVDPNDAADTDPPLVDPTPVSPSSAETDSMRRGRLGLIATSAIKRAGVRDFAGAAERLAALKNAATSKDQDIVDACEEEVEKLRRAKKPKPTTPDDDPPPTRPERIRPPSRPAPPPLDPPPRPPAADPSEGSRALYKEWRAKLDPTLAKLDVAAAKDVVGRAPDLDGAPADDLADDRVAPDAVAKLLQLAATGARRTIGQQQELRLANGTKCTATIKSIEGLDITVATMGGEQVFKVFQLDRRDVCSFASQGLPKDDREAYFLGRGLAFYYAGDADAARNSLKEATSAIAKRFLARLGREGGGSPAKPDPTAKLDPKDPKKPDPTTPPTTAATDDEPFDASAISALVHVQPTVEGKKVGFYYSMQNESEPEDWDRTGVDRFEVCDTTRPGYMTTIRCAEFGVAAGSDVPVLHKVPIKGDFDFTVDFYMNTCSPDRSNLVFVVGYDAKKKRWIGARYGQQIISWDGKKLRVLAGEDPDFATFGQARYRTMRFERKGDRYSLFFNSAEKATCTATGFDEGKWGFLAHDVRLGIRKVDFHGVPDLAFLKK